MPWTTSILKASFTAVAVAACLLTSAVAQGVTPNKLLKEADHVDSVVSGAAARAQAEVQIRKIKSLIITRTTTDDEATYDRLEKLQKQLRGEK
jgi:hypothetical protein